jgi:drug/metabolite transporter (DMT)-like permease
MEVLLGGLAGLVTGAAGAFVAGIFHILAKRLRNNRLIRRGEPPVKDLIYTPPWLLFAILGFIAGVSWTWRLEGTWMTGAIAGCGVPAFASLVWLGWALAQLRR